MKLLGCVSKASLAALAVCGLCVVARAEKINLSKSTVLTLGYGEHETSHPPTFEMSVASQPWALYQDAVLVTVCVEPKDAKAAEEVAETAKGMYYVSVTSKDSRNGVYGTRSIGMYRLADADKKNCFSLEPCDIWDIPVHKERKSTDQVATLILEMMYFRHPEEMAQQQGSGLFDVDVMMTVRGSEVKGPTTETIIVPSTSTIFVSGPTVECHGLLGTANHTISQVYKRPFANKSAGTRMMCGDKDMPFPKAGSVITPSSLHDVAATCTATA